MTIFISIMYSNTIVHAYDSRTYGDGKDYSGLDATYEVDWGAIAWGSTAASGGSGTDLSANYPPASSGDIRYDHFCGVHPMGDHGWSIISNNRWWANKVAASSIVPAYGDYNGDGGYDPNVFKYGVMYYKDYPWINGGSQWIINNIGHDYRRWGIQQYYREKPTPVMTNISINNFPHTYLESPTSSDVWASPTNSGTFYCEGDDRYPSSYGPEAQKNGAVRCGVIGITGSNGLKYLGYTDMNNSSTWYNYATDSAVWRQKSVNGDDKIVDMGNIEYSTSDGNKGLQTALYFKAEDGVDYDFTSNIQNKWRRSSSSYNYFYFNGTKNQRTKLKIDGQAPIWNNINVTTDTSSSNTTVKVSGLKDVRGETKTDAGCGVDSKGLKLIVTPVNTDGKELDIPKFVTSYSLSDKSFESSSSISFNINYKDLGFSKYNKFKVYASFSDNLGNTSTSSEYIVNREIPEPQDLKLSIEKYKYKNFNDNTYWVNCKDNFIIKTQCSSHPDYTEYPNETILFMGIGNTYIEKYNGFSSVSTIKSSDISTSTDKDTYIRKNSEYLAKEISEKISEKIGEKIIESTTLSLESKHDLMADAKASGLKYNLHTIGRSYDDSEWYSSPMYNSNYSIGIDGVAPTVDSVNGVNGYNKFTVNVTNVYDHDLSGSKEVDFIVKRNGDNVTKKTVIVSDKSTISQEFTKDELKGYGEYTVEVWTRDNVDNEIKVAEIKVNMLNPINISAKRVDIYDPRDERYVTQVVSGLDYIAVVEYANIGNEDIDSTRPYSVGLDIANTNSGILKGEPIKAGETKEARFNFTAGEENLLGNVYKGTIDVKNEVEESDENDNISSTMEPYTKAVSDVNPPTIPTLNKQEKPSTEVPIITIKLDLIADYINVVRLDSENVVNELICEEPYRLKFSARNDSSLNIKYIDIKNKSFTNLMYYDNTLLDTLEIDDIGATDTKTFYKEFNTPLLNEGIVEGIKEVKGIVDYNNKINETKEDNNSIITRKKVLGLKVINYRITEMVNPIQTYTYPILYTDMPANVKSGYNVTFRCDVKGKPDDVYAKITDTNATIYEIQHMTKVQEISSTEAIYEYVLTVPLGLPKDTAVYSEIIATQGVSVYNFNSKNSWNGKTLNIGGNAKDDIVIYRKY